MNNKWTKETGHEKYYRRRHYGNIEKGEWTKKNIEGVEVKTP